ncbi:MAG: hypothetical protein ABIP06_14380 [Pyrinomonadaceae bacterium]
MAGISQKKRIKTKPKLNYTSGIKPSTKNHLKKKIGIGIIQELFMQTMSIIRTRAILGGLFLLLLQSLVDAQTLKVHTDANVNLQIKYSEKNVAAKNNHKSLKIEKALKTHLRDTDELVFLIKINNLKKKNQFLILSREPSRKNRGAGFCGAGYEDFIFLIEVKENSLSILDKFLLQSCVKSIFLEPESIDDPLKGISLDQTKSLITFRLSGDSESKNRILMADAERLVIK